MDNAIGQIGPDWFVGIDIAHGRDRMTECEFRRLPDGTLEVLDIRETPLSPVNDKEEG